MAKALIGGEARGKAGVFGSSINPLSIYMQYASQRQRNQATLAAQQKAERDKAMNYLDNFSPSSKFNELNYRVKDRIQGNVRNWYVNNLEAGNTGPRLMGELKRRQDQELAYIEETNKWKEKIDEVEKAIKNDPIRYNMQDGVGAMSAVRDLYKNTDGTLKSDDEIRENLLNADDLKYDPRLLNVDGVVKSFVEKLPEQNRILLTQAYSSMGYSPDQIENIIKSGLTYELGPDGKPLMDENLLPKVVVDEKLYRMAKADPWMNSLMSSAGDKNKQMEWLRQNVKGQGDKVITDRQVISGKKLDEENDPNNMAFGINFGTDVRKIEARRDWLEKIMNGDRPDLLKAVGNLTKDIKLQYTDDRKKIIITYPTSTEDESFGVESPNFLGIQLSPGKRVKQETLDIDTYENKRAARQALSEIIDAQLRDSKQAIGTDNYVRYEEAYMKNKKNVPGWEKTNKKGYTEGKNIPGF